MPIIVWWAIAFAISILATAGAIGIYKGIDAFESTVNGPFGFLIAGIFIAGIIFFIVKETKKNTREGRNYIDEPNEEIAVPEELNDAE